MHSIFDLTDTFRHSLYCVREMWQRKDIVTSLITYIGLKSIHVILANPQCYKLDQQGCDVIQEQFSTIMRVLEAEAIIYDGTVRCGGDLNDPRRTRIDFLIAYKGLATFHFFCILHDSLEDCERDLAAWEVQTDTLPENEPTLSDPEPIDFLAVTRQVVGSR